MLTLSELIEFLSEYEGRIYYKDGAFCGFGPNGPFKFEFIDAPSLRLKDYETGVTIEVNGEEVKIFRNKHR